ncbi:helix-turn-helix transcriptional regulator [Brevibacillus choshinensis]|uniref:YafY family transcriptional regulator n=1 Tax=Brevibacillus choshinensis TaxID=54911 RepID=A0ABX7FKS5_BRECH|nr:YafY family protein [Brevibacillus choshinensis]QRG66737.1 YafY family transcriptional regulator [Brevibacillus choshinensis]
MRADRLVSILLLLQNHGRMTAKELAERLEVSERTIHRDMEALGMAGVPVFAERGTNGGWALTEGYRTDLTGLKPSELQSLLLVSPTMQLQDLGMRDSFEAAWQKLLAASPAATRQNAEHARQRLHIDGAGWHQVAETFPCLPIVQEAVWQERALFIRYQRGEDLVERTVLPLGLVAKRSTWYFVAQVESDLRTYRLSRLKEARMLEESFIRPEGFDLASYWEQSTADFQSSLPRYPAMIRVREKGLARLQQERYLQIKTTHPAESEWVAAHVEFQTLGSACEIVLSYGSLIQVIEPQELRTSVIEAATAILDGYR